MSGILLAKVFIEIGLTRTTKISALLLWDILKSNEGNDIPFDLLFPDDIEIEDVFLDCFYFLFLNVMRRVYIDSRN